MYLYLENCFGIQIKRNILCVIIAFSASVQIGNVTGQGTANKAALKNSPHH